MTNTAVRFGVIVCDMWDAHICVSAARRAEAMVPRMNEVLRAMRTAGGVIIHAPADCMPFYEGTPARDRALAAPHVDAPVSFDWYSWRDDEIATLPSSLTTLGNCSCDTPEPCGGPDPPNAITQQIATIEISPADVLSDDGQEIFNVLEQHGIDDVVVMGVHTNICVLSRWYGIRQLVYLGKRPVLCRDLTDSFHRDPRGHEWGTRRIIEHIERRWCPTVTSSQLLAGQLDVLFHSLHPSRP
jgi:nicotinamidase-related amidase